MRTQKYQLKRDRNFENYWNFTSSEIEKKTNNELGKYHNFGKIMKEGWKRLSFFFAYSATSYPIDVMVEIWEKMSKFRKKVKIYEKGRNLGKMVEI